MLNRSLRRASALAAAVLCLGACASEVRGYTESYALEDGRWVLVERAWNISREEAHGHADWVSTRGFQDVEIDWAGYAREHPHGPLPPVEGAPPRVETFREEAGCLAR